MPPLLLHQALAQGLHQLLEPTQPLDRRAFLFREEPLSQLLQPFLRNIGEDRAMHRLQPAEIEREHPVEAIDQALVLDQAGARQEIEVLDVEQGDLRFSPFSSVRYSSSETLTPSFRSALTKPANI